VTETEQDARDGDVSEGGGDANRREHVGFAEQVRDGGEELARGEQTERDPRASDSVDVKHHLAVRDWLRNVEEASFLKIPRRALREQRDGDVRHPAIIKIRKRIHITHGEHRDPNHE
jgi:hypothetical protein